MTFRNSVMTRNNNTNFPTSPALLGGDEGIIDLGAHSLTRRALIGYAPRLIMVAAAVALTGRVALASVCSTTNTCTAQMQNSCTGGADNSCTGENTCDGHLSNFCGTGADNSCTSKNTCTTEGNEQWGNVCSQHAGNNCGGGSMTSNVCEGDASNSCVNPQMSDPSSMNLCVSSSTNTCLGAQNERANTCETAATLNGCNGLAMNVCDPRDTNFCHSTTENINSK